MPFKLNESQAESISRLMDCFFHEIAAKYEEKKYNEKTYTRLKKVFAQPANVGREQIIQAIAWKYAKQSEKLVNNSKFLAHDDYRRYLANLKVAGRRCGCAVRMC